MKVIILEDEQPNFLRLERLLKEIQPDIQITGPIDTARQGHELLCRERYDLVIADIRLSDGLVFDAFDEASLHCPVLFTTAYDEYALRAFKYNGLDYLLKPIAKDELEVALERASHMTATPLSDLYEMLHGRNIAYRQRFLVPEKDGFLAVPSEQVSYIHSEGGITHLYLKDGRRFVIDRSLDDLAAQLDPADYFRATRQDLIRVDSVEKLINWFNRRLRVQLREYPDAEIIVAKEKTTRLKQWLGY